MTARKSHWEKVYTDKSPLEVSWYQGRPEISLRLITNSLSNYDQPVIDVGGGASLLVDKLQEKGFARLSVLDISSSALDHAKERLGALADKIEWHVSDITRFTPPHGYAVWHDRAVFHFLTDQEDRKKYVEILKSSLIVDGHLILAAFAMGGPTMCSGLDIVQYDAEKLLSELGGGFELLEEVDELHITPANKEQHFRYYRLIRK